MASSNASANGKNKNPSIEDLSEQIKNLKKDLSDIAKTLGDYGNAKTDKAKDAARSVATDMHAAGREKVAEAQLRTEEFVHSQPATALGIAAGIGFLVGMISTSRR